MSVVDNFNRLRESIPENVTIVAVSKTKPVEQILELYNAGHKIFGENRVQELLPKYQALPKDIQWHLIGHLQTNKVKYIVPFIAMIHSVDSLKLISEINKRAAKINRVIDCLIQIHIAQEETKFGMTFDQAEELFASKVLEQYPFVNLRGLMGMATFTDDQQQIRREFKGLKEFFDYVKDKYFAGKPGFDQLSMGMSNDYQIAIEQGSTMVRIGSLIFGPRP